MESKTIIVRLCTPLFSLRLFTPSWNLSFYPNVWFTPSSLQSSCLPPSHCNHSCEVAVCTGSSQRSASVTHFLYNSPQPLLQPLPFAKLQGKQQKTFALIHTASLRSPTALPHSRSHARPLGGRLISLPKRSLLTQGILVAQQSFGESFRVRQTEFNDSIFQSPPTVDELRQMEFYG